MAFKSIAEYNNDRYAGMFLLKNDGDSADVVILYKKVPEDVMVVDAHYIKSDEYSGYTQCLGSRVCPACARGIRVQAKLFVPLYVVDSDEILFWDRSVRFQQQLENDVFSKFADPSQFVFRITRHGAAGDINTRYSIVAVGKNDSYPYEEILKSHDIQLPDYYNTVCKDWTTDDYNTHLAPASVASVDVDSMPEYKLSPRTAATPVEVPDLATEDSIVDDVDF